MGRSREESATYDGTNHALTSSRSWRDRTQHVSFGDGLHRCLGMHLARLETRVLLTAVLDRLPHLRLDPAAEDPHIHGLIFRSPPDLPVQFDPAYPPDEW
jgi:cytochrome P450